jgi:hypothetical protein
VFQKVGDSSFLGRFVYPTHIGVGDKRDNGSLMVFEDDESESVVKGKLGNIINNFF